MGHSGCRLPAVALAAWLSLVAQARAEHLSSDADPPVSGVLPSPLPDPPPPGALTLTLSNGTSAPLGFGTPRVSPMCQVAPPCLPPPLPPTSGCESGGGTPPGPIQAEAAPEPSSLALMAVGAVLGWLWWKRSA
jgi:hypothetical protein